MSDQCVGEIRMFGGNYAPAGWAFCNGQLMSISQNEVLYSLIGTTYGGDGQTTFGLPDLRGRVPIHTGTLTGSDYVLGQTGGVESVTLIQSQLPAHTHTIIAESAAGADTPAGNTWGLQPQSAYMAPPTSVVSMKAGSISTVGGSQPHDNMMPSLTISFIIALQGIFPSRG